MTYFKLAVATDDGKNLIKRHFGDADFYYIYDISDNGYELVGKIQNTVDEEETHADPKKARGIAQLLKKKSVEVVAAKVFGPNIKRIIKKFACVMINDISMATALEIINENKELIKKELDKGDDRIPLKFSK